MSISKRLLSTAPIAAACTFGLGVLMVSLIHTDDAVLDTRKDIKIDSINPVPADPPPTVDILPPTLTKVDVPPAPPLLGTDARVKPTEPVRTLITDAPDFKLPDNFGIGPVTSISMGSLSPIQRIPPPMPTRAERSGHCKMRFNVSAEGSPYDVTATSCSSSVFERASIKAVQRWNYRPQYKDGRPVPFIGNTDTIRFNLLDERGRIIPE